jgi:hypothetical protein
MKQSRFPKGWDDDRVKRVLDHYENQTEDIAVAEDEAAWEDTSHTFIEVPNELVPAVRELLAKKVARSPDPKLIRVVSQSSLPSRKSRTSS